jgi:hypothetical protein
MAARHGRGPAKRRSGIAVPTARVHGGATARPRNAAARPRSGIARRWSALAAFVAAGLRWLVLVGARWCWLALA